MQMLQGHIKKYYRMRISNANVASENDGNEQLKWEQCFTVEVNEQRNDDVVQALYNNDCCTQEWIIDSEDNSTYPVANEGVLKIDVGYTGAVKLNDVFHAPRFEEKLREKKGSLFVMAVGESYVKKISQTDSAAIWHARLGHLGYQLLR
ncbi:hypothetical protein KY284_012729 [Solanum tuberosum]|nr:hypothetical protein KY284_012729 [Solanum tuberosum]